MKVVIFYLDDFVIVQSPPKNEFFSNLSIHFYFIYLLTLILKNL